MPKIRGAFSAALTIGIRRADRAGGFNHDILDKLATDFWSWRASIAFYTGMTSTGSNPFGVRELVGGRDRQAGPRSKRFRRTLRQKSMASGCGPTQFVIPLIGFGLVGECSLGGKVIPA